MYRKRNYRRRPAGRKTKRWYVDASVPKGVPFVGGSRFQAGSGFQRRMVKVARREIARQEEVKQLQFGLFRDTLIHNTIYTIAPTQALMKGVDGNQRTGDQVFMKHIAMKFAIGNYSVGNVGTGQVKYRVMGLWLDKQLTSANPSTTLWSGVGSTDVFHNSASVVNAMINNKLGHKVICDRVYTVTPSTEGNKVIQVKLDCPINRKVTYTSNGVYFKDEQLYFLVIPWATVPTPTTNYAGQILIDGLVTYRDA